MPLRATATFVARSVVEHLAAEAHGDAGGGHGGNSTAPLSPAASASQAAQQASKKHRHALMALYPNEYYWSVGGFLGVLFVLHLAGLASAALVLWSSRSSVDVEGGSRRSSRQRSLLGRSWASVISLVNIVLFRLTLPFRRFHYLGSIADFLIVGAYMGATIAWACMGMPLTPVNNWDERAGLIAAVQVPFIVALAGKNNVISWLTGLGYEKLNVIHRAAGRVVFIISWMHVGAMFYQRGDTLWTRDATDNKWGMAAIVGLSLAFVFSFRIIRNASYELFLMGHIFFIVAFMASLIMHKQNAMVYSYPGFVFWGFDRIVRVARVVLVNVFSRPSTSSSHIPHSVVERLSSDTIRVSVTRSRNLISSWRAGQHFYLIAPGVSKLPWEAHPFTPASIAHTIDGTSDRDVKLDFIIRGRDGFTGRLLEHAIALEGSDTAKSDTFIVDGPYGEPPILGVFDTTIFIAGGSGVSYTLAMLLERIHRARLGRDRTSRVLFVWAIRDVAHINWIAPALRAALDAPVNSRYPLDIDIRIFVTQNSTAVASRASELVEDLDEKASTDDKPSSASEDEKEGRADALRSRSSNTLVSVIEAGGGRVVFGHGRPDIRTLIDEELAASDGLSVSVDVSGPSLLADSVKHVLSTSSFASPASALRGGPSVTLHSETFGW